MNHNYYKTIISKLSIRNKAIQYVSTRENRVKQVGQKMSKYQRERCAGCSDPQTYGLHRISFTEYHSVKAFSNKTKERTVPKQNVRAQLRCARLATWHSYTT